jgi:hypothetical protein
MLLVLTSVYNYSADASFKGQYSSVNWPHIGPYLLYYISFKFYFEFAEFFDFEIHTALWATGENQIFFADTRDLKLGLCRPLIILFIYIHFLAWLSL